MVLIRINSLTTTLLRLSEQGFILQDLINVTLSLKDVFLISNFNTQSHVSFKSQTLRAGI